LAHALIMLMHRYEENRWINIGMGNDYSIRELVEMLADQLGYQGTISFDSSQPEGAPCKLLDSTRIRMLGWSPEVSLKDGLRRTIDWYRPYQEERMVKKTSTRDAGGAFMPL